MRFKRKNLTSHRLKARRRRKIIGRIVFSVICAGTLWGLIFWFSGLAAMNIRDIEVTGTVSVPPTAITAIAQKLLAGRYFYTVPRTNILFYPKAEIEKSIRETYPEVKQVTVRFKNFHAIGIVVAERQAQALWCQSEFAPSAKVGGENCYTMDNSGLIFATSTSLASTSPAFIKFYSTAPKSNPIGQTYLGTSTALRFSNFLDFAKDLNVLGFTVSLFHERPDFDFEARLKGGQRLIFARDADLASVLDNFRTVVSVPGRGGIPDLSKAAYIDFRFGNKVFYKTK